MKIISQTYESTQIIDYINIIFSLSKNIHKLYHLLNIENSSQEAVKIKEELDFLYINMQDLFKKFEPFLKNNISKLEDILLTDDVLKSILKILESIQKIEIMLNTLDKLTCGISNNLVKTISASITAIIAIHLPIISLIMSPIAARLVLEVTSDKLIKNIEAIKNKIEKIKLTPEGKKAVIISDLSKETNIKISQLPYTEEIETLKKILATVKKSIDEKGIFKIICDELNNLHKIIAKIKDHIIEKIPNEKTYLNFKNEIIELFDPVIKHAKEIKYKNTMKEKIELVKNVVNELKIITTKLTKEIQPYAKTISDNLIPIVQKLEQFSKTSVVKILKIENITKSVLPILRQILGITSSLAKSL
jgi:hypothetical protein